MEVAKVDRDYLETDKSKKESASWTNREIEKFSENLCGISASEVSLETEKTRFRLLDDDDIVYYGGWLYNDSNCVLQILVLQWGEWNAGCTTIEVKINGEWKREIG